VGNQDQSERRKPGSSGTTCGICDPRDAIHIPKTADITDLRALAVLNQVISKGKTPAQGIRTPARKPFCVP